MMMQEMLDTSKTLSPNLTSQVVFDFTKYKYCSTYNLAEGELSALRQYGDKYWFTQELIKRNKKKYIIFTVTLMLSLLQRRNLYLGKSNH